MVFKPGSCINCLSLLLHADLCCGVLSGHKSCNHIQWKSLGCGFDLIVPIKYITYLRYFQRMILH